MFTMPDPQLSPITPFDPNTLVPGRINWGSPTNYGPALNLAGGGFAAASSLIAGEQSSTLLKANAALARTQALGEVQAGAEKQELYRQHLEQTLGSQIARTGASGLSMSGSPLRALETTSYVGAQDLQRIGTNAARSAWGFNTTAAGDDVRAQLARQGGTMGAVGNLITSSARAYGNWNFGD